MPRPRRQARDRRPDLAALTRELFYHLTVGWCHFRDAGCRGLEELVEAWAVHGPAILPRWIRHHPGTRPFGWWAAVGVPRHGERRLLSAAEVKAWCAGHDWPWDDCYGDNADAVAEVRQGRLHPGHFGILHTEQWPPMQESEVDYLDRHGLLGRAEVRALDEAAAAGPDLDAPYAHPGAAVWDELQPLAGNGRGTARSR